MKNIKANFSKGYSFWIKTIIQYMLGLVFVFSAILKCFSIQQFIETLEQFSFLPNEIVIPSGLIILIIEFIIGVCLLTNTYIKKTLVIATMLLTLFTLLAFYAVINDKGWNCNCFGDSGEIEFGYNSIIRNLVFIFGIIYLQLKKKIPVLQLRINKNIVFYIVFLFVLALSFLPIHKAKLIDMHDGEYLLLNEFSPKVNEFIGGADSTLDHIKLVIFFDPQNDCKICLTEFILWSKIYEKFRNKLKIIGVGSASDKKFLDLWIKSRKLQFPIIFNDGKEIDEIYKIHSPIKILLNSKNKILLHQKSSGEILNQSEFNIALEKLLK